MKHLKFLFTALAVVGVVGGSLAFKASKFSAVYVFQKQTTGICVENAAQFNPDPSGVQTLTNVWTTLTTPTTTTTAASLCTSTIRVNPEQ